MALQALARVLSKAVTVRQKHTGMQAISGRGWWPIVREPFTGAWQRNQEITVDTVVTNPIVFACACLIARDISKCWLMLTEEDEHGICTETDSSAFSPVIRKPNHFSTRIKFYQYWMLSKLLRGNAYALKSRDARGVVNALYALDPSNVVVCVAEDGSVFYQVGADNLAGLDFPLTIPAREIIHDIMIPLFHPLVGVSPIFACGAAALQGLNIQRNSSKLFSNGSQPGGVLTAPAAISNETAERIQRHWMENFAGEKNVGKVAVLGDGLTYTPMTMTAVDAQLIDQLKWTDERICATFFVPGYMVGIGPPPPYTDIQSMTLQYYTQALQEPIENLEILLTEGLELPTSPRRLSVELDLNALLRMDTKTQVENSTKGILGGLFMPNEERANFDRKPVKGGDTVYLQQQQYSLAALSRRDEAAPPPPTPPLTPAQAPDESMNDKQIAEMFRKELGMAA